MIYQKLIDNVWHEILLAEYKLLFNSTVKVQAVVKYQENKPSNRH